MPVNKHIESNLRFGSGKNRSEAILLVCFESAELILPIRLTLCAKRSISSDSFFWRHQIQRNQLGKVSPKFMSLSFWIELIFSCSDEERTFWPRRNTKSVSRCSNRPYAQTIELHCWLTGSALSLESVCRTHHLWLEGEEDPNKSIAVKKAISK